MNLQQIYKKNSFADRTLTRLHYIVLCLSVRLTPWRQLGLYALASKHLSTDQNQLCCCVKYCCQLLKSLLNICKVE